ncbi:MAG: Gfo/Idh/MocA family oxidoreductase, partial [Verrucomicrobia bacterium]|nr:Gfo/Idh/MocA family oxidoreductase [Verrucomicrobiota bacterium]
MRIGILSFAHMHAESYAACIRQTPGAELAGIFDRDKTRGRMMAQRFSTDFVDKLEVLLARDVDAVIVCSENARHRELVIAAAEAGKHVLCEKPIATTFEDAEAMIAACEANGVKLEIAFPCRFVLAVEMAKRMVDDGRVGRILAIKGTNRGTRPGGWFTKKNLAGGGAVMDHTGHVVDLMRWFMGAEVREVYAEIGNMIYGDDVDDSATLTLTFDNGVFATLDPSWSRNKAYPTWGDVTMAITGTQGVLTIDAFDQKLMLYAHDGPVGQEICIADNMDLYLIRDFVECITRDSEPLISGRDGLEALRVT